MESEVARDNKGVSTEVQYKEAFIMSKKDGGTKQKGKKNSPKQKTSSSANGSNGYH